MIERTRGRLDASSFSPDIAPVVGMTLIPAVPGVPAHERYVFTPKQHRYCVAIFVINEGERVRSQLRGMASLADQIDIVVADGGSTDGSLALDSLVDFRLRALLIKRGPGKLSCADANGDFASSATNEGATDHQRSTATATGRLLGNSEVRRAPRCRLRSRSGSRYVPGGQGINTPLSRTLGVRMLHAPLISAAAGTRYTDTTNGFRAYSRRLLTDDRVKRRSATCSPRMSWRIGLSLVRFAPRALGSVR